MPKLNAVNPNFTKFHQFTKMKDGKDDEKPTVFGVATWEEPDSDNECCDYDTAKPVYQAWSEKAMQRTKKSGQDISLGNIRVQHGMTVGGKVTKVEFDDAAKEIRLGSEPIDDAMYQALKSGMYTGYSQCGSYAWRACADCEHAMPLQQGYNFCENCGKTVQVRYGLRKLAEVSYVDAPAIGEGFEHVKANGSVEILKFQKKGNNPVNKDKKTKRVSGVDLPSTSFAFVGDPEKTETWKLPIDFPGDDEKTKRHIRNALARFEQTQGIPDGDKDKVKAKIEAAARQHGIEVEGEKAASVTLRDNMKKYVDGKSGDVTKGLWQVSRAADTLESIAWMYESSVIEREMEGDDSEVPEELKELLDGFIETFINMATEEARELSAKTNSTGAKAMTTEELAKQEAAEKAAKKSLATHFAKTAAHHHKMAAAHEQLAEEHEEAADHHQKAMEGCQECMGKAKKADVGDGAEAEGGVHQVLANQQTFHKAMVGTHMTKAKHHDKIASLHKKHGDHNEKMSEACDEETAKAVKSEIATEDAKTPEVVVKKEKKAVPTMEDDVEKAAEERRNTPEYKKSISDIAEQRVEAELAKLRGETPAPTGTAITEKTGADLLNGARIVKRNNEPDFDFAKGSEKGNFGGL